MLSTLTQTHFLMDKPQTPNCNSCGIVKSLLDIIKDLERINKLSSKIPDKVAPVRKIHLN